MKVILASLAVVISACATATVRYIPIDYKVIDQPEVQSLRLVYENKENKRVCIGPDNWPSTGGIIDNSGDEFYIEVAGNKYLLQSEQDYCPSCVTKVRPRQTIEAKLNYASFRLPETLYSKPKTLHLKSTGYVCR